jgi:hypothetical protein
MDLAIRPPGGKVQPADGLVEADPHNGVNRWIELKRKSS